MMTFAVPDMTCGHCVSTITRAIRTIDSAADVQANLSARTVKIQTTAPAAGIVRALEEAGYPARPL